MKRTFDTPRAYNNAMQGATQTTRQFATYLEDLEEHLDPYTEEQRIQHLFSKLREDLQSAIIAHHLVIPSTREQLITIATLMENSVLKRKEPASHQRSDQGKQQKRGRDSRRQQQRYLPYPRRSPDSDKKPDKKDNSTSVLYYHYNKKGYIRPNYPDLNSAAKGVNTTPV